MTSGPRKPQKYNRDENEPAIAKALRAKGYIVTLLNDPGVPDLLVIAPTRCKLSMTIVRTPDDAVTFADSFIETSDNRMGLLEVKQPGGTLTDTQQKWWNRATLSRIKTSGR